MEPPSESSGFDFLFRLCDGGIRRSSSESGDFAFVRVADRGRDSRDLGLTSGFLSFDGYKSIGKLCFQGVQCSLVYCSEMARPKALNFRA